MLKFTGATASLKPNLTISNLHHHYGTVPTFKQWTVCDFLWRSPIFSSFKQELKKFMKRGSNTGTCFFICIAFTESHRLHILNVHPERNQNSFFFCTCVKIMKWGTPLAADTYPCLSNQSKWKHLWYYPLKRKRFFLT